MILVAGDQILDRLLIIGCSFVWTKPTISGLKFMWIRSPRVFLCFLARSAKLNPHEKDK